MVVRKASVSKALFDAFLPVLPLAMVLPGFVNLACVIRVLAFDFSFAGTPFSRVAEVLGRMTRCAILTVQL
jgi:hypothetical protein